MHTTEVAIKNQQKNNTFLDGKEGGGEENISADPHQMHGISISKGKRSCSSKWWWILRGSIRCPCTRRRRLVEKSWRVSATYYKATGSVELMLASPDLEHLTLSLPTMDAKFKEQQIPRMMKRNMNNAPAPYTIGSFNYS